MKKTNLILLNPDVKRFLTVLVLTLFFCSRTHAQKEKTPDPTYRTAIGIRPFPFAVSFKINSLHRKSSFEINGYFRDGFTAIGFYEWYFTLNKQQNLKAYFGPGGAIGFLNEKSGGGAVLGLSGVIGLDYKFLNLPLNLSLDWQPSVQFGKNNDYKGWGGIAARFAL